MPADQRRKFHPQVIGHWISLVGLTFVWGGTALVLGGRLVYGLYRLVRRKDLALALVDQLVERRRLSRLDWL